jgi:outer membrane lipoprotein SlyB
MTNLVTQDTYTISEALPLTDDVASVRNGGIEFSRIAEIKHWCNEAGRAGDVVRGIFGNCTGGITKNHR